MIAFLYLPILVLFAFSFSTNTSLRFPIKGLTLDWYASVGGNAQLLNAARNSLVVGVLAATVATALGLAVGIAVVRFRFIGRRVLLGLAAAPLVVPFVVLAVGLFLLFNLLDVPRSLLTIAAGHSMVAMPYATLILLARLAGMDPALEDAAMDLGATYPTTLRRIVIPMLGPSLLSAWLTCFIVSFDEIALANFLAGRDPTFPVFLYGQLRFAQQLPVLIAMAVLLMLGTVTLTLVAYAVRSRDR
jgi:spermidine/putrescine transport system permease protein